MNEGRERDENGNNHEGCLIAEQERLIRATAMRTVAAASENSDPKHLYVSDPSEVKVWHDLLRNRRVYIMREIDEEIAYETVQALHWLEEENPRKPIYVYISTPGGDVFAGLAIFDTIRSLKSPTYTICLGWTASMGGILLQAGKNRLMTPRSWLMIHEIQSLGFSEGGTSRMEDEVTLLKRMQDQFLDIFAEKSKMKRIKVEESWKRKDWWLEAPEALKLGLIDSIADISKPVEKKKKEK